MDKNKNCVEAEEDGNEKCCNRNNEKRLSPYGFRFAWYEYLLWTFSRDVEGVTQCIAIQESRWEDAYALNIYIHGVELPTCQSKSLTNESEYKFKFFHFSSEEERIIVLTKLLDIAERYGINKLNKLTEESRIRTVWADHSDV